MTAPTDRPRDAPSAPPRAGAATWAGLGLAALTVAVYAPVAGFDFVNWDDGAYVFENRRVLGGLTWDGFVWALTTGHAGAWHPLTWLSFMLDASLFGPSPGAFHVVNLALHVAATLLCFGVFLRTTGALGRAAFVAALFAVHPTHVESVAWISERKDVLSAVFFFLGLRAYVAYAERPSVGRYVAVAACFVAGLMSKPMVVTFPFVLLLLDAWPLRRAASTPWRTLVREKLPLFAITAAAAVLSVVTQDAAHALHGEDELPLGLRVVNALTSYVAYVGKTLWPTKLSAFYPLDPAALNAGAAVVAASALAAVTWFAARQAKARPWLLFGWLWFLGTLVPVIGLVQFGGHSMADRFSYVPSVGLFVALAWGVPEIAARLRLGRFAVPLAAAAAVAACAVVARRQLGFWKDGQALWARAAEVTENNLNAHVNLGVLAMNRGELDVAETELREAVRIAPTSAVARNDLGLLLMRRGDAEGALAEHAAAVRADPSFADAHAALAAALVARGRLDEAVTRYREAIGLKPEHSVAHGNLASALADLGRLDEAILEVKEAVRLDPGNAGWHANLARVLLAKGDRAAAAVEVETALRLDPRNPDALLAARELGR